MKSLVTLFAVSALAACTTAQLDTARTYQGELASACGVAMTLAPLAGPVAPWIIGGCASEAAVAKLALDPGSLAWVKDLIAKASGGPKPS